MISITRNGVSCETSTSTFIAFKSGQPYTEIASINGYFLGDGLNVLNP